MKLNIKRWIKLHFPLILLLVIFSSCEDEELNDPEVQTITVEELDQGELAAVVDGEVLLAETVTATVTEEHFALSIVFNTEKGLTIITDTLLETSFTFGAGINNAIFARGISNTDPESFTADAAPTGGGELLITNISMEAQTVSGTFEMVLHEENNPENEVVISSAAFNSVAFTIDEEDPGSFFALVDGEEWSPDLITVNTTDELVLEVKGTKDESFNISLFMPATIEEGSYPLSEEGDYVGVVYPEGETDAAYYSISGELEIIEHDLESENIVGRFAFDASPAGNTRVYEVREGSFSYEGY